MRLRLGRDDLGPDDLPGWLPGARIWWHRAPGAARPQPRLALHDLVILPCFATLPPGTGVERLATWREREGSVRVWWEPELARYVSVEGATVPDPSAALLARGLPPLAVGPPRRDGLRPLWVPGQREWTEVLVRERSVGLVTRAVGGFERLDLRLLSPRGSAPSVLVRKFNAVRAILGTWASDQIGAR